MSTELSNTADVAVAADPGASNSAALNPVSAAVEGNVVVNKGQLFTSKDVAAFEVPTHHDEAWRYTPLRRLGGLHDGSATATGTVTYAIDSVDGDNERGLKIDVVGRADARLGEAGLPFDRVAAQAFSGFEQATIIEVAANVELAGERTITVGGPGAGEVAFGHLQIRLGNHASAVLVLDHRGGGTVAENVELLVADGARLTVVDVFDFDDDAVWVAQHHVRLGRDASIKHVSVQLGGKLVRLTPHVVFDGPGGNADLFGLYFADDGQHLESRLLVDHSVPNCTSNVLYKGALQADPTSELPDAVTVWVGDVLIRAEAEGTRTYELNRNLVLTDGARAVSVPNLEILTGEIEGAGHASATGRFDDEQLFYLQSRGIDEQAARRLVVRGFFGEVIARIEVESLRERLTAAIESELARSEQLTG